MSTTDLTISFWDSELSRLDEMISVTPLHGVPALLQAVPFDVFALLHLETPERFHNLAEFLPKMPSGDVQEKWNGARDRELLRMSVDFLKRITAKYEKRSARPLGKSRVLDFGCGWGRLLRLMEWYVPRDRLHGVDAWEESLDLCRTSNLQVPLARSDEVPFELPFEPGFDLIYAFSIFTHLSPRTMTTALATLRRYVSDNGWLFITIRPKEYWRFHDGGAESEERLRAHERDGVCFVPHNRPPVDGDITYGDVTFTLDYLRATVEGLWVIDGTDYSMGDLLQVIVSLKPA